MKKQFYKTLLIPFILSNSSEAYERLLLIDTGFNNCYTYNNFLFLAQSVGFKPDCKAFYNVDETSLANYDCIIIDLDSAFISSYFNSDKKKDPITQKISSLILSLKKQKKKLIGIMLPSAMGTTQRESYERALALSREILPIGNELIKSCRAFLNNIMKPDYLRSRSYHTTLLTKKSVQDKDLNSEKVDQGIIFDPITHDIKASFLPLKRELISEPLAWYGADKEKNAQFFITKASLVMFSEIAENFFYNPMAFSLRLKKLNELQQLLHELYCATILGKLSQKQSSKPVLPEFFSKEKMLATKKQWAPQRNQSTNRLYNWINKDLIWCGWLSLDPYTNKEDAVTNSLLNSGLNLLWLELYPEWYLSSNGLKKNEKESFLKKISIFTQLLQKNISKNRAQEKPHVFAGLGVTSNFAKILVENPVVDVYGKIYSKVPSPFDFFNLWQQEVLSVIDNLCGYWYKVGHRVPLAGIFFDFEMYHAQDQTGQYTSLMDFSDLAWNLYCDSSCQKNLKKIKKVSERTSYLLQKNAWCDYFSVLQHQAFLIGKRIKDYIKRRLPHALIGVYNIYLPHTWFYMGLMAGMSSKKEPIILATFNNDFYRHYQWLQKNGIYAYHLPALLLSKFKQDQDFQSINDVAQYHDGAWFNKISRLEESRNSKDWAWDYEVEVTPLATEDFMRHLQQNIKKIQLEI